MCKRIAILVQGLGIGGAERVACELSELLERAGHTVFLLTTDNSEPVYPHGGTVHGISFRMGQDSNFAWLWAWQHVWMTWRYKRRFKIDIVISFMEYPNLINMLTPGRCVRIPTLHNYRLQYEITPCAKDRLVNRLFSLRAGKVNRLVVVAEALRNKVAPLYRIPPKKIVTIYNASDADAIAIMCRQPADSNIMEFITPHTFVSVCRQVEQKGLDRLIRAFSIAAGMIPDARLIMIGDGHLRGELQQLAEQCGVGNRVLFTGFLSNPFPIVEKARALVLSSVFEGFGLVLVEAMCCGTCVISTDCECGPREILAPGTSGVAQGTELAEYGILTSPDTEDCVSSLADAMTMMANDDTLYSSYQGKLLDRAMDFAPEKIAGQWEALIEGIELP